MSELETNGYITCAACNTVNKLKEIGNQGLYNCGKCKNPLILINKENSKSSLFSILVVAGLVGVAGSIGINQINDYLKPKKINYSQLDTSWSREQVEHFDRKCKANLVSKKINWSSERIAKTCTCFTSYIVEKTDFPRWNKLSETIINNGAKECS